VKPGTLKYGDWVRTADGAIGTVKDGYEGNVDVAIDGRSSDTVTLPLAELRRIPDPAGKLPPIEGLPALGDRPTCPYCGKRLVPWVIAHYRQGAHDPLKPRCERRVWDGSYHQRHGFCTWSCAGKFAAAAVRAGYRITRKESKP
jgi:hypothetical protein